MTTSEPPPARALRPAEVRRARRASGAVPLPDPRLAPIGKPEAVRDVPPRLAAMKALGGGGTLGLEVALSIMVGLFGGQWLDGRAGSSPWLTLLGSAFGLAAAVRAILRQMRIMRREAAKEEAAEGNPAPLWESEGERKERERADKRDQDEPGGSESATVAPARKDEP